MKSGFKSLRKLSSPEDIRSPSTLANRAQSDGRLVLFARNQAAEQRVDSSNKQAARVPTALSIKKLSHGVSHSINQVSSRHREMPPHDWGNIPRTQITKMGDLSGSILENK